MKKYQKKPVLGVKSRMLSTERKAAWASAKSHDFQTWVTLLTTSQKANPSSSRPPKTAAHQPLPQVMPERGWPRRVKRLGLAKSVRGLPEGNQRRRAPPTRSKPSKANRAYGGGLAVRRFCCDIPHSARAHCRSQNQCSPGMSCSVLDSDSA